MSASERRFGGAVFGVVAAPVVETILAGTALAGSSAVIGDSGRIDGACPGPEPDPALSLPLP
jgi:hypothetical protein